MWFPDLYCRLCPMYPNIVHLKHLENTFKYLNTKNRPTESIIEKYRDIPYQQQGK